MTIAICLWSSSASILAPSRTTNYWVVQGIRMDMIFETSGESQWVNEHPPASTRCHSEKSKPLKCLVGWEGGNFQPKNKKENKKKKKKRITKWSFGFCECSQVDWEAISEQNRSGMFWWWSAGHVGLPAIKSEWCGGFSWSTGELRKLDTRKNAPQMTFQLSC